MHNPLFTAALGLSEPWYVKGLNFDEAEKRLTIRVDFRRGSRFEHGGAKHPVHDTQVKRYRHLNFFQHECVLEARVPRVRLPDGRVALVKPPWAGRLSGFSLLFEALVMSLCREMPFAAVARLTGVSWHRVVAICTRYVELAVAAEDLSGLRAVAIDETSRAKGHDYVTVVANAKARRVVFVHEGKGADTVARFAAGLAERGGDPDAIESASIDMSRAYIKGVAEHLPNAEITFDKFHVVALASKALDKTRRLEQRADPGLKGLRWALLKKPANLSAAQLDALVGLLAGTPGKRTTRAWVQLQQLSAILQRRQIHVVKRMLHQWCTNVNRSKVDPMKAVAKTVRKHLDGIAAWARTRQTNGFLEALNGLIQAAKRKARGYRSFQTMRTVIFLVAGKLDFDKLNPQIA